MPRNSPLLHQRGDQELERFKRGFVAKKRGLMRHHRIEHILFENGIAAGAQPVGEGGEIGEIALPHHR